MGLKIPPGISLLLGPVTDYLERFKGAQVAASLNDCNKRISWMFAPSLKLSLQQLPGPLCTQT